MRGLPFRGGRRGREPAAPSILDLGRVHAGHAELLRTLREFRVVGDDGRVNADPEALRGAVAYLRHELVPFARFEERVVGASTYGEAEAVAFEHAFLAAEIDDFADAVSAYLAAGESTGIPAGERAALEALVVRSAYRIEAVLELHVQKESEAWRDAPEPGDDVAEVSASPGDEAHRAGEPDRPAKAPIRSRPMSEERCRSFLAEQGWGVLATSADGVPYAVPVSYAFDGRDVYVASGPGRKTRNLDSNPAACLTIVEVADPGTWRSVVVIGKAERLHSLRDRMKTLRLLHRNRNAPRPTVRDVARIASTACYRIRIESLTGREQGASAG